MRQEIEIAYKVVKIQTTKFSFEDIGEEEANLLFKSNDRLGYNINLNVQFDPKKAIVSFLIETKLFENENRELIIEHIGKTEFFVDGFGQMNKEDEKLDIPDELLIQWIALAYSHARALLTVELSPTYFRDLYFLPVVDPKMFLRKN